MAGVWPVEWWDDLAGVARDRLGGGRPRLWRSERWVRWKVGAGTSTPARPPRPHTLDVGPSNRQLLEILADQGPANRPPYESAHQPTHHPTVPSPNHAKSQALRTLAGRPPEPALIPLVPGLAEVNGELPLPGHAVAVQRLGASAVPEARAWAVDGRRSLSWLGILVLADHGTAQDLPVLMAELSAQEAARQWCGPSEPAAGIARFGSAGAEAGPVLRRLWLRTPHSYERPASLKALAVVAPSGLDFAYVESLWDCESNARLLRIAHAPDPPRVRERLAQLRDDPVEDAEVRARRWETPGGRHSVIERFPAKDLICP